MRRARAWTGLLPWMGLWALAIPMVAGAAECVDGGAFSPASNINCELSFKPDGVYSFTTITIPAGVTVTFTRNAANSPVTLNATGSVAIHGTINVSAGVTLQPDGSSLGSRNGGPGGGNGGVAGLAFTDGGDGAGPSPGLGGPAGTPRPGHAGGGGGMATAGGTAVRHSAFPPAPGGAAIAFPDPLTGGSSGGGGGGWEFFTILLDGGTGGGAGGAIRISTPAGMTITGTILASGADGGTSFANAGGFGGPGGGGSGGVIDLAAASITVASTAQLRARGGAGGGIGTLPIFSPVFSSEADGGLGFVRLASADIVVHGVVEAFLVLGTGTPYAVNPFLCYKTAAPSVVPAFTPPADPITLADQFQTLDFLAGKTTGLCTPADKRNEGLADPATHLKGYQLELAPTTPRQVKHVARSGLTVVNQLGTVVVDTVKPEDLLVPAAKDGAAFPTPPDPGVHHVDHYVCYKVKVSAGAAFSPVLGVPVVDQFDQPKRLDLKKPTRLCVAADKNDELRENPDGHLLCYQAKPAKGERRHVRVTGLHVTDQFGQQRLDTIKEEELCVPSLTLPP